ncbi:hypothetical protein TrLO_g13464 [Triparma laevis f. longispina]|uniref:Uncharacterized protein n=1 Tax=Triparma laevis f. longispina TaxID=1714387 RepID=A0A9W7A6X2_9STRA|nr:hypothetical protein TrLO_g13464 [Triparma laevis f. longispina]
MNATLVISVTAAVMAVAITIAVFFAINGDPNAADYNYKVSFTTEHSWPDGTAYATGSGTIVVNSGVQSFTYTDASIGQTTVQEDSGLGYISHDSGRQFRQVLPGDNFEGVVTSFEMSKDTPFDVVAVPESADVNIDFCEEARSEPAECTITGADGDSDSVNVPAKCCSALNAWQEFEIDVSTTAMGDCEAFDLCAGSCGNMLEAVWVLQDDSGDDEDKAAAAAARTNYESFCALQDFAVRGQACEDSGRRTLLFEDDTRHWRERITVTAKPKADANVRLLSKEERESNTILDNLAHEERNLRVSAHNRRKLIEEHGEDFHRHLSGEDIERRLSEKRVCYMHGMGGMDDSSHYWGHDHMNNLLSGQNVQQFWIATDSKYCDFWPDNTRSHSVCTGVVPSNFIYKAFIDHHECNVIIAHSMGNPTMAEVYRMSGNDAKYMWYDTNGPMKGSTTATVLMDYINSPWIDWTSFFSVKGAKAIVMKGLTEAMGYA